MFMTISLHDDHALDLGWILHKHPERVQTFPLSFGSATVFWSEVEPDRATCCLAVDVDPVALVRGKGQGEGTLDAYVNDRPYAASSFLAVALREVFATALAGRCAPRPELPDRPRPLEATVSAVRVRCGMAQVERLFQPLGWAVTDAPEPLDPAWPAWGEAAHRRLTVRGTGTVQQLLTQLSVLVPAIDADKHYWVGEDEVEKLLRRGDGWLSTHPEREWISRRYLNNSRPLTRLALSRLVGADPDPERAEDQPPRPNPERELEASLRLQDVRISAVLAEVVGAGARRVLDLGCGEGDFLRAARATAIPELTGVDVSHSVLEKAARRLKLAQMSDTERRRFTLLHSSLTYTDSRLTGFDAAVCVEVIEHLEPHHLGFLAFNLFQRIRPPLAVLTTPNAEYNVRFPNLPAGRFRHPDHRFEWDRATFARWVHDQCARYGYTARFAPIGEEDPEVGAPTQMAVLTRAADGRTA